MSNIVLETFFQCLTPLFCHSILKSEALGASLENFIGTDGPYDGPTGCFIVDDLEAGQTFGGREEGEGH